MDALYLVVMAGGSGTRFWPKSTRQRPKQLISFLSKTAASGPEKSSTLLGQTLQRFKGLVPFHQRMIVTTKSLRSAVEELAPGIEVLAEPQGRNTAPCIYWAARVIAARNPKAVMLVMPSDHFIADSDAFRNVIEEAAEWASRRNDLVTLGIKPSRPDTGFGYLRTSNELGGHCLKVDAFVEKPNRERAEEYVRAGNYFWNAGMFLWRAEVILEAFDHLMPELKKEYDRSAGNVDQCYGNMTATSIDYGIMEKASNVVTFPLECGWDDLGSWPSLEPLAERLGAVHAAGVIIEGEVVSIDSARNIIDVPGRLVALLGVQDLIVVETDGVLLVAQKDRAQDVKKIVDEVQKVRPELI